MRAIWCQRAQDCKLSVGADRSLPASQAHVRLESQSMRDSVQLSASVPRIAVGVNFKRIWC